MGTIRKYDEESKQWKVISTSDASTISVRSEKLLPEGTEETNVEQVLMNIQDDLELIKGNIAWLALHGGGGSGGGIGGGTVDATIVVNGYPTGSSITFDEKQNLVIEIQSSQSNLKWDISASGGNKLIKSSGSTTKMTITKNDLDKAGLTNTFQLAVTAYNSNTLAQVYWNGTIYIATVSLFTNDVNYKFDEYTAHDLTYNYKIGVTGNYVLKVNEKDVWSGNLSVLEGDITIGLDDIEGLTVGSNKIISRLQMADNPNIKSQDFTSFITLTADVPIINCTSLSNKSESPTEVYINSGATTVVLTPYTVYYNTGTYKVRIYSSVDTEIPDFDTIQLYQDYNKTYNNASYSLVTSEFEKKITITISIQDSATNKEYKEEYYIITKKPKYELLDNGQTANLIFDYIAYEGNISNKVWTNRNSSLTIINQNEYSENIQVEDRSLRLQNASYGVIKPTGSVSFYQQLTSSNIWQFTLSICYKADFHPDDNRTILCFANTYDKDSNYAPAQGIVIRDHMLYVGQNTLALQDQELINLTITYRQNTTDDYGNAFVYIDGVLEAVFNIKREYIIPNTSSIYLASQVYNDEALYFTDVNIYRVSLYKTCLNPYHILFDYLNNEARTHLMADSSPDTEYIENGLKRNLITTAEDGSKQSLLWDTTANFDNNSSDFSNCFTLGNLVSITGQDVSFRNDLNSSSYSIPIPMMLIDVSHDTSWTWKNFITPKSALNQVDNCRFQYFDQTQTNSSIITGNVSVSLQGTSTLADFVKNLNITFADDAVFIPKETWFPEKVYTLKADIVDSSHSLNTSVGKFVNTEFGFTYKEDGTLQDNSSWYPFSEQVRTTFSQQKSNPSSAIQKHFPKATLKHGIEGFPIFLIMRFNDGGDSDAKTIATLGIYQFILGRDSARNLGYSIITGVTGMEEASNITYPYYKNEGVQLTSTDNKGYWVEMTQNDSFPDSMHFQDLKEEQFKSSKFTGAFWQEDNGGNYYTNAADIKYTNLGAEAVTIDQLQPFKDFVRNVVQLPVTNRRYSVEGKSTLSRNTFSNLTYPKYVYKLVQSMRAGDEDGTSYSWELVPGENNNIVGEGDPLETVLQGLNIESISKYFVIAMFLGLIDNFQKNMPIKIYRNSEGTWENPILGIYDTDTGCGGTNEGDIKVTEDVWICPLKNSNKQLTETYENPDSTEVKQIIGNSCKLWYLDSGELNYTLYGGSNRDGSIFSGQWNSFLKLLRDRYGSDKDTPVTSLSSLADMFIDRYFIPQTEGCGEIIFNLTYFSKYLNKYQQASGGDPVNQYSKLHGRRIKQIRNWLRNRIKFLDSMFYAMGTPAAMPDKVQISPNTINISSGSAPSFYISTNYPVISAVDSQGSMNRFVYCQENDDTEIYWGSPDITTQTMSHTIGYSDAIQRLGNDEYKLSNIAYQKITAGSLPYLTDFDLSNCSTVEAMNADGMNNFKLNGISELRNIDCSNTAKSGNTINFVLNLTQGFQKLQNVNIYNSCVSQLELPSSPNIPLLSLNIVGAQLTSLSLNQQNLLTSLDITNCNKLSTLRISNCEKLTSLSLNSTQSSLKTVEISSGTFKSITCTENDSVKTISITSDSLQNVSVTNCLNLESITISGKVLNKLDLHGCRKLTTLNIVGARNIINTINLQNTSIKTIQYDGTSSDSDVLDLSRYSQIDSFSIGGNQEVEYIQFKNDLENPITLTNTFNGCTKLKRVYGNLNLAASRIFNACTEFSIHGSNINQVRYNGKSVLDETRVKHPLEISGMIEDSILQKQSGNKVTNISFTKTDGSYMFYGTNCTLFDIYYALYNIGTLTSITYMFGQLKNARWEWTENADNSPNKNLFINCGNIVNADALFYDSTSAGIRLFSPTFNEEGEVEQDNGLFSPLVNCTNIRLIFGRNIIYTDRFIFRRKSGNYKFTNIGYFRPGLVVDDVNKLPYIADTTTYFKSNYETIGNFGEFFKNTPDIVDMHAFGDGTTFINYDKTKESGGLGIPSGVRTLKAVLRAVYGTGNLVPEDLFQLSNEKVLIEQINHSFLITKTLPTELTSKVSKATFKITSNMLSKFTNLVALYFDDTGDNRGSVTTCTFNGVGLEKVINQSTFPFDILEPCKNTIQRFGGFFQQVKNNGSISSVALPGDLFQNTPNITSVSALFYNFQINYTLTQNSFSNCPKLSSVAYIFGNSGDKLQGSIPSKLFYHGEVVVRETYTGADLWDEERQTLKYDPLEITGYEETGAPIYRGVEEEDIQEPKTITYKKVNSNITWISNIFENCNCSAYINTNPEIENNPNYRPWTHILVDGKWQPVTRNMQEKTFIWEYDGVNIPADYSGENLDDEHDELVIPTVSVFGGPNQGTLNYMCAPDLFRYCNNVSSLSAVSIFSESGHDSNGTLGYTNHPGNTSYGIKGRICPYLLKPVPQITNISSMFKNCKQLSYYTDDGGTAYLIPKSFFNYTPNLTTLTRAFQGLIFPKNISLDVFRTGANSLRPLAVSCIFFNPRFDGTSSERVTIKNIFGSPLNISELSYAFSVNSDNEPSTATIPSNIKKDQYVTFDGVFNKYSRDADTYVFDGYDGSTVQFLNKSLRTELAYRNYRLRDDTNG